MNRDQTTATDPTEQHHHDDFGEQSIDYPGLTGDLDVQPDHGEQTYRGAGRLTGRRAIVTGGDSGIGRAVAIAFAREGADVLIAYLDEEETDAQQTADWIRKAGRNAVTMPGGIQQQDHCAAIVQRAVDEFGGVDILVNNAAHQMAVDGLASLTTEQMERTYRTNVFAMIWLCQAALEHMQPGSAIINTASIQASQPSPQLYDYATTKAAIVNFTKNLAQEAAERGIRVNAVDLNGASRLSLLRRALCTRSVTVSYTVTPFVMIDPVADGQTPEDQCHSGGRASFGRGLTSSPATARRRKFRRRCRSAW